MPSGRQEGIQALRGSQSTAREECDIWKMKEIQSEIPGPLHLQLSRHPSPTSWGGMLCPIRSPRAHPGRLPGTRRSCGQGRREWVLQQAIQPVTRRGQGQESGVRIKGKQRWRTRDEGRNTHGSVKVGGHELKAHNQGRGGRGTDLPAEGRRGLWP